MPADPLLFALGASRPLGERVAAGLGIALSDCEERTFEDGEFKERPLVDVRGREVFAIASLHGDAALSASDRLCRLLFFLGALKDAGAVRTTAVAPYLCFGRKDRRTKQNDPITTRYVAALFEAMQVDRVIVVEPHNLAATENAFRCGLDVVDANQAFIGHFLPIVGTSPVAVVSPDPGGVKRADLFRTALEEALGRPVAGGFMEKHRSSGAVTGDLFAADVAGRLTIVLDDMISTGGTMARMAEACRANGAVSVHLAATHGLFSEGANRILAEAAADGIVVADTVPLPASLSPEARAKVTVVGIADTLAGLIRRSVAG